MPADTKTSKLQTALWTVLLAAAVLWPGRALGVFDGAPLSGRAEAIIVGLLIPALWWLDRRFLSKRWARVAILALVAARLASLPLAQQGLCARFSTSAPFSDEIQTIPIEEPRGFLRSWDVRADWRADVPTCTAIVDRSYRSAEEFPAWFVNILDFIRPGRSDLSLDLDGYVRVEREGLLSLQTGEDMTVAGRIGENEISAGGIPRMPVRLQPGVHFISLHGELNGERWALLPQWNDGDAWKQLTFTTVAPRGIDAAAGILAWITSALVLVIAIGWSWSAMRALQPSRPMVAWTAVAIGVLTVLGTQSRYERLAGPVLLATVLLPLAARHRSLRNVFLLLGIPWLAFFASRALGQVGRFSIYSADDWLTYQVAGYRIFMNGYWLEGGSKTFDYQPLYRWISGALHLLFGDSSVGEVYWDAACLLMGGLLAYELARPATGYRAALAAAAGTLATFTIGTPWYFFGRGLSEIASAGFAFLAAFFLLRARLGRATSAYAAGMLAVLMFYTRLNHLMFAAFLPALLLPLRTPAFVPRVLTALRLVRVRAALLYSATFAAGVVLLMTRTWWYTGTFSLLYGTSLKNNDTGLRLTTIASPDVWQKVGHSLSALVWMNEPPHPDLRAAFVVLGVLASVLAVMQVPMFRRVPASIAALSLGGMVSALFVHTHNYPGRMSVHLVPFAAVAMVAAGRTVARVAPQFHRAGS